MADKNTLSQMLENLVNGDQSKAEELFHEYIVAKSREIYEGLIESEMTENDDKDEDDEDEEMDESFEDVAFEADDEMGGDPTDDLVKDIDDEEGDEEGEESEEEIMNDLESIIDELQAKFDELKASEEEQGEFGGEEGEMGDEEEMKDDFDLETVREYVEKVPSGHGAEKKGAGEGQLVGTGAHGDKPSVNAKSIVDNMKNDMGGTTQNIVRGDEEAGVYANQGQLKGSSLIKQKPTEDNAGNINVPGGKAGNAFSKKEPGHGAEKKGTAEKADNKASLFRGRR